MDATTPVITAALICLAIAALFYVAVGTGAAVFAVIGAAIGWCGFYLRKRNAGRR